MNECSTNGCWNKIKLIKPAQKGMGIAGAVTRNAGTLQGTRPAIGGDCMQETTWIEGIGS
jgi:hypothetical protein